MRYIELGRRGRTRWGVTTRSFDEGTPTFVLRQSRLQLRLPRPNNGGPPKTQSPLETEGSKTAESLPIGGALNFNGLSVCPGGDRTTLSGDELCIQGFDGNVKISRRHAHNNIHFAGALIDHLDVNLGAAERRKNASRDTDRMVHSLTDNGDECELRDELDLVWLKGRADFFEDVLRLTPEALLINDDDDPIDA